MNIKNASIKFDYALKPIYFWFGIHKAVILINQLKKWNVSMLAALGSLRKSSRSSRTSFNKNIKLLVKNVSIRKGMPRTVKDGKNELQLKIMSSRILR